MIRTAICGIGKIALDQHIPTINSSKNYELVAIISNRKYSLNVPQFSSISELVSSGISIDAITLATPPAVRFDLALEAISHGYNLMLEKPPCSSVEECSILIEAAEQAKVTIFAGWHSKYALMISFAREWIEKNGCDHFEIFWKEDYNKWHPGQKWIKKEGGLGVFDSGINALSMLCELMEVDFSPENVLFLRPSNWKTPIAVSFSLKTKDRVIGKVEFDWRVTGDDIWDIKFFSGSSEMVLSDGGKSMTINKIPIYFEEEKLSEYKRMYKHFEETIIAKKSSFDFKPLQYVSNLYKNAIWKEIDSF